jgi:hypothetical protein
MTSSSELSQIPWAVLLSSRASAGTSTWQEIPLWPDATVVVSDFASTRDDSELVQAAARDFAVPHPIMGLDALLSGLSDLEWMPSTEGYVWQIDGVPELRRRDEQLTRRFLRVAGHLIDRWRGTRTPFRIVIPGGDQLEVLVATVLEQETRDRGRAPGWVDWRMPPIYVQDDRGWRMSRS